MENNQNIDFLGRGWAYPPAFSRKKNGTEMVAAEVDIHQSLEILLATQVGERVMNRKYGTGLELMLHEPLTQTNVYAIAERLKEAVIRYEPRISVDNVTATQDDPTEGRIDLLIEYTISARNSKHNFVYPYYIEQGGELL